MSAAVRAPLWRDPVLVALTVAAVLVLGAFPPGVTPEPRVGASTGPAGPGRLLGAAGPRTYAS